MANKPPYTPDQMNGKFISCSKVDLMKKSVLACVTYTRGPHTGSPVLYDSINDAKQDRYFDKYFDEVVPAVEYFQRIAQK